MGCIVCDHEAGYNRAVVTTATQSELGGLCMNCERREFGSRLELQETRTPSQCSFCDQESYVALPKWEPDPVYQQGELVNRVTYGLQCSTPKLCHQHFQSLCHSLAGESCPSTKEGY